MTKIIYINGEYVQAHIAKLSVNDRSFLFSDAVYEVVAVYNKKLIYWKEHIDRLKRSLKELKINYKVNSTVLKFKAKEIIEKNCIIQGLIYIQISRGVALRNHNWTKDIKPSLIISGLHKDIKFNHKPIDLISSLDIRWSRCDIKSVSLLPNVMLKQKAKLKGAFECVMIDAEGFVTEATTSNLWIIKNNDLITRPDCNKILAGVTRKKILEVANLLNINVKLKKFYEKDIHKADAVFISNSSNIIIQAKSLNKKPLNSDKNKIIEKLKHKIFSDIDKYDKNY